MTALQLNAELYRAMGEIADNEKLLAKVLAYVKGLVTTQQKDVHTTARIGWAAAAKQAHADVLGGDWYLFYSIKGWGGLIHF